MKVLFWQWNAFMQKGIEKAFAKLNITYEVFYFQPKDWENDAEFERLLSGALEKSSANVLFSVNFAPVASSVCQSRSVKYVSWVYDSPVHIRDISSFANECNRIYFFDRGQCESYQKQGYTNVFHMPLAVDESVWNLPENVPDKYSCDVAFVGQLYESDFSYLMGPVSQYYRGRMDGIVCAQGQIYGAYLLDELITDELMAELNKFYVKASGGKFKVTKAEMEYACAKEVTGRERKLALSLLASRYKLNLYSKDTLNGVQVSSCGYVDYYSQMPVAFAGAKVNLNISLKTIRTGIPLRVLDVLSCGGFLITNYQEELFEYFEPGVDLVVYEDVKDLIYKVDYYLKHEEARKMIAENGRRKVCELFGFEERVGRIFDWKE